MSRLLKPPCYVLVDIGEFIRGTDFDDVYFAEWLTRRVGIAPVPGSSFFREPVHNPKFLSFDYDENSKYSKELVGHDAFTQRVNPKREGVVVSRNGNDAT